MYIYPSVQLSPPGGRGAQLSGVKFPGVHLYFHYKDDVYSSLEMSNLDKFAEGDIC